jgi:putative protein-disulfide isomerase
MTTVLHYIYDPLCGWCYGAAPLVRAARDIVPVVAHGGGMMAGDNRQRVSPQLRNYVMPHDQRIAQATGQAFGQAYFEGLLRDETAVFDSAPPIAAVLAAEQLSGSGLDMLAQLQVAHYVHGQRIADANVLLQLAQELGLEPQAFQAALKQAPVSAHIKASRALLARVGGQGFPTFALETEGLFEVLNVGAYLGRIDAWCDKLRQSVASQTPAAAPVLVCGIDGCQ